MLIINVHSTCLRGNIYGGAKHSAVKIKENM